MWLEPPQKKKNFNFDSIQNSFWVHTVTGINPLSRRWRISYVMQSPTVKPTMTYFVRHPYILKKIAWKSTKMYVIWFDDVLNGN